MNKNKNIYVILVILFIIVLIYNYLNPNSFTDQIKSEYLPKGLSGKVYDYKNIKGGSIALSIHTANGDEGISIANVDYVLNRIEKGIYFKKISNSNKCYVIKGDSIMYFSCYVFSKEDSLKIGEFKKWSPELTNKWFFKN